MTGTHAQMVAGLLQTVLALLLLTVVFSLPFIGLYLTYTLVWPRISSYIRGE